MIPNYLKDRDFLKRLDNEQNKFYWVKIEVLDSAERMIQSIEGRVKPGSTINIDGNSSIRRTCSFTIVADEDINDLTNVNNLLSVNKKIRVFTGLNNEIDDRYDPIIWFPQGIFVISQPNISRNSGGWNISLSCKDKMCLLNGEAGGSFPTSVTFHEYSQIMGEKLLNTEETPYNSITTALETITDPNNYTIYSFFISTLSGGIKKEYYAWDKIAGWSTASASMIGSIVDVPQTIYDIIQTLVCNYGGEDLARIYINDVPKEIKQLVRYTGSGTLYYNNANGMYQTSIDSTDLEENPESYWQSFEFNEDVGYMYTDFVYPGQLISNIGDNVCTILDKIKNTLGNYEYFYDLEGNFVFQEIKNYLNNTYDAADVYRLDNNRNVEDNRRIEIDQNNLAIINGGNYQVDFNTTGQSIYTFNEGNGLISSYTNTPVYSNLKNDFHIWGLDEKGYAIHYHLAIKSKPTTFNTYNVVYIVENDEFTGRVRLSEPNDDPEIVHEYTPDDWRAELYLRGLQKQRDQIRPDIYEQELLDLFDAIYNFKDKCFKADLVTKPNVLNYFFDYLEPSAKIFDYSVDSLGTRIFSYKQDHIVKLYSTNVPDQILISTGLNDVTKANIKARCRAEGQSWSGIKPELAKCLSLGTVGYSAQEVARDLLYKYTNYNESITIQCMPIYYLEPNRRITVVDSKTGINGDYLIKSMTMPIGGSQTMTINATKIVDRI